MSTDPPPNPAATPGDRKRLIGCGVVLVVVAVLLVLAAYGLGLWGGGEVVNPPGPG